MLSGWGGGEGGMLSGWGEGEVCCPGGREVLATAPPPGVGQTNACENITFACFATRAVINVNSTLTILTNACCVNVNGSITLLQSVYNVTVRLYHVGRPLEEVTRLAEPVLIMNELTSPHITADLSIENGQSRVDLGRTVGFVSC